MPPRLVLSNPDISIFLSASAIRYRHILYLPAVCLNHVSVCIRPGCAGQQHAVSRFHDRSFIRIQGGSGMSRALRDKTDRRTNDGTDDTDDQYAAFHAFSAPFQIPANNIGQSRNASTRIRETASAQSEAAVLPRRRRNSDINRKIIEHPQGYSAGQVLPQRSMNQPAASENTAMKKKQITVVRYKPPDKLRGAASAVSFLRPAIRSQTV